MVGNTAEFLLENL